MCNQACIRFAEGTLREEELRGKDVLEVGSLNVNGSIRERGEPLPARELSGVMILLAAPGLMTSVIFMI